METESTELTPTTLKLLEIIFVLYEEVLEREKTIETLKRNQSNLKDGKETVCREQLQARYGFLTSGDPLGALQRDNSFSVVLPESTEQNSITCHSWNCTEDMRPLFDNQLNKLQILISKHKDAQIKWGSYANHLASQLKKRNDQIKSLRQREDENKFKGYQHQIREYVKVVDTLKQEASAMSSQLCEVNKEILELKTKLLESQQEKEKYRNLAVVLMSHYRAAISNRTHSSTIDRVISTSTPSNLESRDMSSTQISIQNFSVPCDDGGEQALSPRLQNPESANILKHSTAEEKSPTSIHTESKRLQNHSATQESAFHSTSSPRDEINTCSVSRVVQYRNPQSSACHSCEISKKPNKPNPPVRKLPDQRFTTHAIFTNTSQLMNPLSPPESKAVPAAASYSCASPTTIQEVRPLLKYPGSIHISQTATSTVLQPAGISSGENVRCHLPDRGFEWDVPPVDIRTTHKMSAQAQNRSPVSNKTRMVQLSGSHDTKRANSTSISHAPLNSKM